MRLLNPKSTILYLLLLCAISSTAQDIHMSHIHASPTLLNPSLNGLFTGDTRLIFNARTQWTAVTEGYKTVIAGVDNKLMLMNNTDFLGGGFQVYSDVAGDLSFRTTAVSGALSMLKSVDGSGSNYVSFGVQTSYVTQGYNPNRIIANDENDPVLTDGDTKTSYFDLNAGVSWFYAMNRNNSFYVGASLFHLNKPDLAFSGLGATDKGNRLYRKWLIHGGADLRLGSRSYLKPTFIIKRQGPHNEYTMGSFWKYKNMKSHRAKSPSSIHFGAWVRWHADSYVTGADAVIGAIRMDYDQTYFTFTFDLNISTLYRASNRKGGPELSVVHILSNKRKRTPQRVRCPNF